MKASEELKYCDQRNSVDSMDVTTSVQTKLNSALCAMYVHSTTSYSQSTYLLVLLQLETRCLLGMILVAELLR